VYVYAGLTGAGFKGQEFNFQPCIAWLLVIYYVPYYVYFIHTRNSVKEMTCQLHPLFVIINLLSRNLC
jgi:hypothetical protein